MGNKVPSLSRNASAGMNDFQAVGIGDSDSVIETGTVGPRPPVSTPRKQQVAPEPKDSIVIPRDTSTADISNPPTPQRRLSVEGDAIDGDGSRRGSRHNISRNGSQNSSKLSISGGNSQASSGLTDHELDSNDSGSVNVKITFDFSQTEGQSRRALMADYEYDCSEILPLVYVGGAKVAGSLEILRKVGIRRIVNCSAGVVPNHFIQSDAFTYMSLNMVDGRDDDITWFVCQVLKFVETGVQAGVKTLVHCEKGISRSCSFVIAYVMWSMRKSWSDSFNVVKMRRQVCNPNTAFTCNIMELNRLLHGAGLAQPVLLRYAAHLPHDIITAVLKPVRDSTTRKLIAPKESMLDNEGIFVLQQADKEDEERGNYSSQKPLYLWLGQNVDDFDVEDALKLATLMLGVLSPCNRVEVIRAGKEPPAFWEGVDRDGPHKRGESITYADLWPRAAFHTLTAISEGRSAPVEVPTSTLPMDQRTASPVSAPACDVPVAVPAPTPARLSTPPTKPAKPPKGTGLGLNRVSPAVGASTPSGRDKANATPSSGGKPPGTGSGVTPNVTPARRTPTPTLDTAQVRRTPPGIKTPHDVGLARGPTPLEDMKHNNTEEELARRLSVGSRGSDSGKGDSSSNSNNNTADQDTLLSQHQRQAELALQNVPAVLGPGGRAKPLLYVLTSTGVKGRYEWQAMGVYDDEDLVEEDLFLLFCPKGPHHVWVGTDFEDMSVLELPTEAFKEWAASVRSGDCDAWVDIFPVDIKVQLSGTESEEFWDQYSLGF